MTDPEQQVGAAEEDEYEGEGMEEEGAEDGEDVSHFWLMRNTG
jgi:hypothetical protein